ncbi:glucose-6-phosphate dehydrogenase [Couchioplanes caeruleus]|uniref:glucose-6-phosphate dehydrogenase n=1 Tax=Couchioplanes caeruleus TaxID=56438 RepID=UPI00201C12C0|nr:glucose-6-phosphate dehydrogenase [Couchioplanes caeruleus]UQU62596.1 glucose-6-phosphate dehydrogenase [Couchioplanes caeruleus]
MIPSEEPTLVVLGAAGDLTARLLLPGLAELVNRRHLPMRLVGSDRADWDDDQWRNRVRQAFAGEADRSPDAETIIRTARYVQADVTAAQDLDRLLGTCPPGPVVLYFALPPAIAEQACRALTGVDLPAGTRLVLEKPFGSDAASADALNEILTRLVPEDQVHRVDHYLGLSTVLNIFGLRYTNRMLESVLNSNHVSGVDILLEESLALEGRAGYYDSAGALVDMLQSHALHVLSLVAMEPPSTLDARDVRDGASAVLRATRVWGADPVRSSRRARYTAATVGERSVPSYADEEGVDPDRRTETFAEVIVEVNTWRWAGVPFRLRTGKALRALDKRVVITFKEPNWVPEGLLGYERSDRLHIGLDPEVLRLDFNVNGLADPRTVERVAMHTQLEPGDLPAYGQVLAGVLAADPTLSVRGDQAVRTWQIMEPVLRAWRADAVPLLEYEAGGDGPPPLQVR